MFKVALILFIGLFIVHGDNTDPPTTEKIEEIVVPKSSEEETQYEDEDIANSYEYTPIIISSEADGSAQLGEKNFDKISDDQEIKDISKISVSDNEREEHKRSGFRRNHDTNCLIKKDYDNSAKASIKAIEIDLGSMPNPEDLLSRMDPLHRRFQHPANDQLIQQPSQSQNWPVLQIPESQPLFRNKMNIVNPISHLYPNKFNAYKNEEFPNFRSFRLNPLPHSAHNLRMVENFHSTNSRVVNRLPHYRPSVKSIVFHNTHAGKMPMDFHRPHWGSNFRAMRI